MIAHGALTPERLTYYGFKHSQGAYYNQLGVFRHVLLTTGIEPNLDPSVEEQLRYVRYLSKDTGAHINPVDPTDTTGIEEVVRTEFERVKSEREKYGQDWEISKRATSRKLAGSLLRSECRILDLQTPWANYKDGKNPEKRARRLAQRVRDGQVSFLHYYGRDGHRAGAEALDRMYADVWKVIAKPHTQELAQLIAGHEILVQEAEAQFALATAV